MISQTGASTPKRGDPIYHFGLFFPKVHEIEQIWIEKGAHDYNAPLDPPTYRCLHYDGNLHWLTRANTDIYTISGYDDELN